VKKTIGATFNSRDNSFHFLRFFAASLVIFDHSFPLYGHSRGYFDLPLRVAGSLALPTFFIISGFLITKSWLDSPDLFSYLKKRCLRILPGLAAVTLFAVFIIGPMATTLGLKEYFTNSHTWSYLLTAAMLIMTSLPGVFVHNTFSGAVNGSLWTLPYEFWMYLFIAGFGLIGMLSQQRRWLIFLFTLLVLVGTELFRRGILSSSIPFLHVYLASHFTQLGGYFILGSLFYLYQEKIVLNGWFMVMALAVFALPFKFESLELLHYLSLPYIVLYFAFAVNIKLFKNFGKYGDFSYGMYIYAFIVQQSLVHLFGKSINFLFFNFLTFTITFLLAFLSWNLIEKQAMKLKNVNIKFPFLFFKVSR